MPGCYLRCSRDVMLGGIASGASMRQVLQVPARPALAGTTLFAQSLVLDAGANQGGAVVSNSVRFVIGY